MPGLVPGIHVFLPLQLSKKDVDGRDEPSLMVFGCVHPKTSDQILFGDDFAKP
jgi:hypothetical protein